MDIPENNIPELKDADFQETVITDSEEQMNTAVTEVYDASQIQVLEGLEAVRKRPGMYIGSTGPRGLHHLVYEILDNSIDEALAGYCTHIEVEILPGDVITVRDNGRGIPTDINEKQGLPAVTVVLTVLHAGGKFGGSGYKVSGGLHGVGSSVVNALSEWLEVEVSQNGHIHKQRFERGAIASDLEIIGDTNETGTLVRFKADPEIFTETTVYEYETLQRRIREQAFLNAGLRISLTDRRDEDNIVEDVYCFEGGLSSFVKYINESRALTPLHETPMHFSVVKGDRSAEVAIMYNDSYNENILSFANNVRTIDGGTHETGFKNALTKVILNNKVNHREILNQGDVFLLSDGFKKMRCDFFAGFILVKKNSRTGMSTLTGIYKLFAVFLKMNAKVYQVADDFLRGANHNLHGIGVVFEVTCTHCVVEKRRVVIFVTEYTNTALCKIRVAATGFVFCNNNNVFIFRQIKCTVKTCHT